MSDKREYGTIHDMGDYYAMVCGCGSVHFNLLQSGMTECAKCGFREYKWLTVDDYSQLCLTADKEQENEDE